MCVTSIFALDMMEVFLIKCREKNKQKATRIKKLVNKKYTKIVCRVSTYQLKPYGLFTTLSLGVKQIVISKFLMFWSTASGPNMKGVFSQYKCHLRSLF